MSLSMKDLPNPKTLSHLKIIGLTGGIGSGKSTVANHFENLGAVIIDADQIAHEALDKERVRQKVIEVFGPKIRDSAGKIKRSLLAEKVFGAHGEEELKKLTDIIHPEVRREIAHRLEELNNREEEQIVILDVPLLMESPLKKMCQMVIFVDAPKKERQKRVLETRGWDQDELQRREERQMDIQTKRELSDFVISNDGDLEKLQGEVQRVWNQIQ